MAKPTEQAFFTRITPEQHRLLSLIARVEGCRQADIVQRALTAYLREHGPAALRSLAAELKNPAQTS